MDEFRRGWRVLLGAFIGVGAGASSLYFYSVGLFLKPLAAEFHWSRGEASLGPLVATLGAALFAFPTGLVMDRIGPVRTALGSMLLLALSFAALGAGATSLLSFVGIIGFLGSVTVGTTAMPYSRLIVNQFHRTRGLALGVVLASAGLVGALMPPLLAPFIAASGWRAGYFSLAVAVAASLPAVAILLRSAGGNDLPTRRQLSLPGARIFVTRRFHVLWTTFFTSAVGALGAVVHLPALVSDLGGKPHGVGVVTGAVGLAAIAGRLGAGVLLDRMAARWVVSGLFLVSAVGTASLPFSGPQGAIFGAVALGLTVGAETAFLAFVTAQLFAPADYGRAYGGAYSLFLVGGALGQWLLGWGFDRTGDYGAPFALAAGCLVVAGLLALLMPRSQAGAAAVRGV